MMLRWSVCCRLRRYDRLCQDAFLLLAFQPFEQTRCIRCASFGGLRVFLVGAHGKYVRAWLRWRCSSVRKLC
jgi:hypothetical protein